MIHVVQFYCTKMLRFIVLKCVTDILMTKYVYLQKCYSCGAK